MGFENLKLKRQFLNAVKELGYTAPTPVQVQAIPKILAGQDLIGVAQTGTGKTGAYVLPLLQKLKGRQDGVPRVAILVPTKELALQVHNAVQSFAAFTDIRSLALVGGVGPKTQIAALELGVDVVVATPGRFLELYLRGALVTKKLTSLVLDEADRMMDMGFMPQLRDILEVVPRKRQNLLFSATFPTRVERLADEFLLWPTRIEVTPEGTPVTTVKQHVVRTPNVQTKINLVLHLLTGVHAESRALLFVRTKEDAKRVRSSLEAAIPRQVAEIHSNKAQHTRLAAMGQFREGAVRVLVSTDVSARGIDVPETELVINFNVPRMSDDYVHRIGRTGRAERSGVAYTLVDPTDEVSLSRILERLPVDGRPSPWVLPEEVDVPETPPWEAKSMAKTIDFQRRKADPTYKGAFHEKKRKGGARKSSSSRRARKRR
ncbi:MAG: DEAD/DEAH box helicase [Flavobacteriales bacterium]